MITVVVSTNFAGLGEGVRRPTGYRLRRLFPATVTCPGSPYFFAQLRPAVEITLQP
jgi:hypothetical protein